jgi:hypothetical protein
MTGMASSVKARAQDLMSENVVRVNFQPGIPDERFYS